MKDLMVERNPMDVSSVGMPLIEPVTFSDIEKLTLEWNPMDVSNVGKPSISALTFKCTEELTHK
jgi:hypothetical protein